MKSVEKSMGVDCLLNRMRLNSGSTACSLSLLFPQLEAIEMADVAKPIQQEARAAKAANKSPLETAKEIAATMCRQPKEAHWLGVRMENFLRVYERKIGGVTSANVCDYLEALMRKGQVEWQVKQSLDAIGLLVHRTSVWVLV